MGGTGLEEDIVSLKELHYKEHSVNSFVGYSPRQLLGMPLLPVSGDMRTV
jgi:hypothetical protein